MSRDSFNPKMDSYTAGVIRILSFIILCAVIITQAILYGNIDYSRRIPGVMLIVGLGLGSVSFFLMFLSFGVFNRVSCYMRKNKDKDNWPRIIEYLADRAIDGDGVALELVTLLRQELELPDEKRLKLRTILDDAGIVIPQLV